MPAPTITTLVMRFVLKGFVDGTSAVAIHTEVVVPEVGCIARWIASNESLSRVPNTCSIHKVHARGNRPLTVENAPQIRLVDLEFCMNSPKARRYLLCFETASNASPQVANVSRWEAKQLRLGTRPGDRKLGRKVSRRCFLLHNFKIDPLRSGLVLFISQRVDRDHLEHVITGRHVGAQLN